jgi:arylsulfatase A-like enzyme
LYITFHHSWIAILTSRGNECLSGHRTRVTAISAGPVSLELANDWGGFSGTIPKSAVTVAEVLKNYGYNTGALGQMPQS